ncbi:MAG: hypothetical protein ACP5IO_03265 [Elusimicrobiales bacterium]
MKLSIEIAQISISFVFDKKSVLFYKKIKERYFGFLTDKSQFTVNLYQISEVILRKIYIKREPLIICGEGFIFEQTSPLSGNLFIKENIYFFENFLRIFISQKLMTSGDFLIHSAGIFHKGYSILFPGKSGSGKTTLSTMLCGDFEIMSDEICAVVRKRDVFYLFSTPFWGGFKKPACKNLSGKLTGVFFLKKSRDVNLKTVSQAFYFKNIMKTIINFSSSETSKRIFLLAERIYKKVPTYLFGFSLRDYDYLRMLIYSFFEDQKNSYSKKKEVCKVCSDHKKHN